MLASVPASASESSFKLALIAAFSAWAQLFDQQGVGAAYCSYG